MITDRELLELAAKAADIQGTWADYWEMGEQHYVGIKEPHHSWGVWNPLTDDGDALRLAVKLKMDVQFDEADVQVWGSAGLSFEYLKNDHSAAVRRAIVRAAAEIGKATGEQA